MGATQSDFDFAFSAVDRLADNLKTILAYLPILADRPPEAFQINGSDAVEHIAEAADEINAERDIAKRAVAAVREELAAARLDLACQDVSLRVVVDKKPVRCAHDAIVNCAIDAASYVKAMDGEGGAVFNLAPVNVAELRKIIRPAAEQFVNIGEGVPYDEVDALLAAAVEERDRAKRAATGNVAPPEPEAEPDGPCGNYQWRHNGVLIADKMKPRTWKLAAKLYEHLGRQIQFNNLIGAGKVFEDELASDGNIQKQGSRVTRWFADHGVPLKVSGSTVDRVICMESLPVS